MRSVVGPGTLAACLVVLAAPAMAGTLTGTATYRERIALPPDASFDPRLKLQGMFTYMADAASIRLCSTGQRLPVAMEKDYLALERAYMLARPADKPGQPLLVDLQGLITQRPSMEAGQPPRRTLVVEKFVSILPGKGCPSTSMDQSPPPPKTPPQPISQLRGTSWRLLRLGDQTVPSNVLPGRSVELLLAADQPRFSGSGGCNRLMGEFQLEGETLRLGKVASTMMACPGESMEFERRYITALEKVRRWSIDKRNLLLQDASGMTLMRFQAGE